MIHKFTRQRGGFLDRWHTPPPEFKEFQLYKDFETNGKFWLPSNPRKKIPGFLRFKGGGPASLVLQGLLTQSHVKPFEEKFGVINGELMGGVRCTVGGYRGSIETHGKANHITKIIFDFLLLGGVFRDWKDILLNKIDVRFTHLDEWFEPPIKSNFKDRNINISFVHRNTKFEIEDGNKKFIIRHFAPCSYPAGAGPRDFKISYENHLIIESKSNHHIEWFLEKAGILRNFFSFVTGKPVFTLQVKGSLGSSVRRRTRDIPIYFIPQHPEYVVTDQYYFGTVERDVKEKFLDMLQKWFFVYEEYKTAFQLYFSLMYTSGSQKETIFLNLAQCAEHLHALLFPVHDEYFESKEWKRIHKALKANLPADIKMKPPFDRQILGPDVFPANFLKGRFNDLNRVTLQTRMQELIRTVDPPHIFGAVLRDSAYGNAAQEIAKTRNDLTHPKTNKPGPTAEYLHQLCIELWAIITYWLARQFISDESVIHNLVLKSRFTEYLVRFPKNL